MLRHIRQLHATARKLDVAKMTVVGRVGTDFAENMSANDTRYLKYSIATQGRKDAPTSWYNVVVFNEQQINFLTQYVNKGALVYVEADVKQSVFEREDGTRSYSWSLVQREINLLKNGRAPEAAAESQDADPGNV